MWEFAKANGTTLLLLLMVLACPLMHAFGHGRVHRHRRAPSDGKEPR